MSEKNINKELNSTGALSAIVFGGILILLMWIGSVFVN